MLEVSEYFERLDVHMLFNFTSKAMSNPSYLQSIQETIRSSLAHIRHSRIAPSTINAPPPGFIPPSLGVGLPSTDEPFKKNRGLQEERIERDAWKGILDALTRLKAAQEQENEEADKSAMDQDAQ